MVAANLGFDSCVNNEAFGSQAAEVAALSPLEARVSDCTAIVLTKRGLVKQEQRWNQVVISVDLRPVRRRSIVLFWKLCFIRSATSSGSRHECVKSLS